MAESLANFLIELGVDAGSSLKRIEEIEKKLSGLNQIKGLNKEIKAMDRKVDAVKRVAQVQSNADKEFLKDSNARIKIHKMWEKDRLQATNEQAKIEKARQKEIQQVVNNRYRQGIKDIRRQAKERSRHLRDWANKEKQIHKQKQQAIKREIESIKALGDRRRKIAADEAKRQNESTRQTLERRKLERQLNSITSEGLQKQVALIRQAAQAWDGNRAKLGHIKQDIVELKDRERALATRAKEHSAQRNKQIKQQVANLRSWAQEQNRAAKEAERAQNRANDITKKRMRLLEQLSHVTHDALQDERKELERLAQRWNGNSVELLEYQQRARNAARQQRDLNRTLKEGSLVANGFRDSMRNMVRSYISIFAIATGATFINRTAQEFESLQNSMIATSGSAQNAADDFDFVKNKAKELGVALKPAVDGFAKLSVAGQDIFSREEITEMWTGLSEAITAFGLSSDDARGSYRAVMQMMSKGKVTAEELRQQLGERMPIAMQALGRSTGWGTEKLDDLLQKGQVGLEVLPGMIEEMRKMSRQGGLLGKQMDSLRAQQNRFNLAVQEAVVQFSDAGFKEGMANFFRGMTRGIEAAMPLWKALGKISKPILSFIGTAFEVIGEALGFAVKGIKWIIDQFNQLGVAAKSVGAAVGAGLLGKLHGFGRAASAVGKVNKAFKVMRLLGMALMAPFAKILFIGVAVIGLLDEIANIFRSNENKKIGLFSAPEGYEAKFFDIAKAFEDLKVFFEDTWEDITEIFSWQTVLESWKFAIDSIKKLWNDFLVWAGLKQSPEFREGTATEDFSAAVQRAPDVKSPSEKLGLTRPEDQQFMNMMENFRNDAGRRLMQNMGNRPVPTNNQSTTMYDIKVDINGVDTGGDPRRIGTEAAREIHKEIRRRESGDFVND